MAGGRPPKVEGRREVVVRFRVSIEEVDVLWRAALRSKISLSEFLREAAFREAFGVEKTVRAAPNPMEIM